MLLKSYHNYCITLPRAVERRKSVTQEFEREKLVYSFYPGFDNNRFGVRPATTIVSAGAVGCWISHFMLMQQIVADKSIAMITEDDVSLARNFNEKLCNSMLLLPNDWEIAFIGWYKKGGRIDVTPVNQQWSNVKNFFGMHCYLVNGARAVNLIGCLGSIQNHIDHQIADLIAGGLVKAYWLTVPLASQQRFETQIDKRIPNVTVALP